MFTGFPIRSACLVQYGIDLALLALVNFLLSQNMKNLRFSLFFLLAFILLGCGEKPDVRPEAKDGNLILQAGSQYYQGQARFTTISAVVQMVFSDSSEVTMNISLPNQTGDQPETGKVYEFDPNSSGSNVAILSYLTESGSADPDRRYRISSGEIRLDEVNQSAKFIDLSFNLVMEKSDDPDSQLSIEGEGQNIPWN